MTVLEELLIKIGVTVDEKQLVTLQGSLEKIHTGLSMINKAAIAAASAFAYYATKVGGAEIEMMRFAKANGLAFESVQELAYAAKMEGASAESMMSTLAGLTDRVGEAARNGDEAFRRLGISIQKPNGEFRDSVDLLYEITERVKGLSLTRRRELLGKVGIDGNMVNLIGKGTAALDAYRAQARKAGITTEEQVEKTIKMQQAMLKARQEFQNATLPIREMVYELGTRLAGAVSVVTDALKNMSRTEIKAWVVGLTVAFGGLSVALAAFSVVKFIGQMAMAIKAIKEMTFAVALLDVAKKFGIAGLIAAGAIGGGYLLYKGYKKSQSHYGEEFADRKSKNQYAATPTHVTAPVNNMYGGASNSVNQTIKIDISGAQDAAATGRAVASEIRKMARLGIPQFNTAVV